MTDALTDMDAARLGPHVTCPASRHAAMISEALIKGESYAMLAEEPAHCGESIAATVAALWKARANPQPSLAEALALLRNAILTALAEADAHDHCLNLRGLSVRTGLPRETLRGLVADLRSEGLVVFVNGLWSEAGMPAGSGYGITRAGLAKLTEGGSP